MPQSDDELRDLIVRHLRAQANGGVMVTAQSIKRIAQVTGSVPTTPDDFVRIAEKSVRQRGDKLTFEWSVDPIHLGPMREMAQRMDVTMENLMQIMIDQVVQRGILFTLTPEDTQHLLLTGEQMKALKGILGIEHPTGADVVQAIEAATAPAFAAAG